MDIVSASEEMQCSKRCKLPKLKKTKLWGGVAFSARATREGAGPGRENLIKKNDTIVVKSCHSRCHTPHKGSIYIWGADHSCLSTSDLVCKHSQLQSLSKYSIRLDWRKLGHLHDKQVREVAVTSLLSY